MNLPVSTHVPCERRPWQWPPCLRDCGPPIVFSLPLPLSLSREAYLCTFALCLSRPLALPLPLALSLAARPFAAAPPLAFLPPLGNILYMKREVLERTMQRAAKLAQEGEMEKAEATYRQALEDSEVSSVAEVDYVLGEYAEFLGHTERHAKAIECSRLRANLRGQHAPERSEVYVTGLIDLATACRRGD